MQDSSHPGVIQFRSLSFSLFTLLRSKSFAVFFIRDGEGVDLFFEGGCRSRSVEDEPINARSARANRGWSSGMVYGLPVNLNVLNTAPSTLTATPVKMCS